jgi:class 3 adenylate cyclase/tetratricopeptide (TPR) repeat protein
MKCSRCQHENPADSRFCFECGSRLALACGSCGAELPAAVKFCNRCGQAVGPPAAGSRSGSPESYTPKHLAEKILTSKAALEGERKQVTVLFADLKGSMELLADRDPEEARKVLDPVIERMMEAVHRRYEGTVNQVLGDGIMALFGAPVAHEDHAVRACYAALRMQESVKRYAEEVHRSAGVPLHIRVGMNSGEVVVRSIGSDLHMDYTAIGQTTHIAARLEQMTMPGSVLLSPETLALAEGYITVKPLGTRPIKGLEKPLEIYELVGAATVRSRFHAAAARGLTRFVGREMELDQLRQALERARAGHGQVVAVVGEPGVGKSRLYWEFSHSHRAQGWLILESGSVSYGKATNYLPTIELLRSYFSIESTDDNRKIREKVTGKLLSLDRQLESCVSPILWLLDVAIEDRSWERLDPPQRRQHILEAVKRVLLCESQVQPLMILFEDLHWIDAETQTLLDSLLESLPTARLLLLVNYRPEYSHGWGSKTYYRQLQIDPLPLESAEALLDVLLGTGTTLAPLKQLVIERAEGNPFLIEETVRSLVETGVLAGERGAYRLTGVVQGLQVPATAQAMLAARIDRLAPEDKRLLQAAAVIGTDVPFGLLRAVADEPMDRLRQGLARLQASEFLYETRLFPDLEYTFKHALTHEVAYGALLHDKRRALHARILNAIEMLYRDRLGEYTERLAHHAVRAEMWEKAFLYLREAGAKALDRSANREAVAYLEHALRAAKKLPERRETIEQACDLRLTLRNALFSLAEHQRIFDLLKEAVALAEDLGDRRRLGRALAYLTLAFWARCDFERASETGRRALDIAEALDDYTIQVPARLHLGYVYQAVGNYKGGVDLLARNVAFLQGDRVLERYGLLGYPAASSRGALAMCLAELGEFTDAIAAGAEAVRVAETARHPYTIALVYLYVSTPYLRKGEFDAAISLLERSIELGQIWDFPAMVAQSTARTAAAYALTGRVADALPLLAQSERDLRTGRQRGLIIGRPITYLPAELIQGYLEVGQLDEALDHTLRAHDDLQGGNERGYQAWVLKLLGDVVFRRTPEEHERSEVSYRQALVLADELGMRPLVAHCHLGLGKLYLRTGKREQAREHLATATTMYREMGMTYWLEKAEAEQRS